MSSRQSLRSRRTLWLRWSWRDLRGRWLQVLATALVIAMGTGLYGALGGMRSWREGSNDRSFGALHFHDLRVSLSDGSFVAQGRLLAALRTGAAARAVAAAEERLTAPTQIDVAAPDHSILSTGQLVGIPIRPAGQLVDALAPTRGRRLTGADAGRPVAILDAEYAKAHGLPAAGRLRIGRASLAYVGHGRSPQYFLALRAGGWTAPGSFAAVFVPLAAAQRIAGRPGAVNEIVVRYRAGVDAAAARRAVAAALASALPETGFTLTDAADEGAYRMLYRDARNDQKLYDVFALLLLAGASFAAFNLISRVVEAQRREIGIGMALGVEPRTLATRPLLLAAEIAVLGVAFGVGVGVLASGLFARLVREQLPLPYYDTAFQPRVFLVGALLGFLLPFAATVWPVWRGVRVTPIEAIRVGFRAAKGAGLSPALRRLSLPGGTLAQMPVRNVARAPRRALLTALGLAAVITALASLSGMIDSFQATIDRSSREVLRTSPARIDVTLDRFHPDHGAVLRALAARSTVVGVDPSIRYGARVGSARESFDVAVSLLDDGAPWHPSISAGRAPRGDEILLSEAAAEDLAVGVGDRVALREPVRAGRDSFRLVTHRVRVAGLHPDPFRSAAYMEAGHAAALGLTGLANAATVLPASGASRDAVRRSLMRVPGVAAAEPASAATDAVADAVDLFTEVIRITATFALALALLMAFNATSIAIDERIREYATMFAFGVPLRTAIRVTVVESLIVGTAGTVLGIAFGVALTGWVVNSLLPQTLPELGAVVSLSPGSIAIAAAIGIGAVGAAPLLMARRLRRMDLPATLRVVE